MHEACHAGTVYPTANKIIRAFACCFGTGGTQLWTYSHLRHHNVTNDDTDPDCDQHVALRYKSQLPLKAYHKFQIFYSTFMYMLTGLVFHSDNILPAPKMYKGIVRIPPPKSAAVAWFNRLCSLTFVLLQFVLPVYVTGSARNIMVFYACSPPIVLFTTMIFQVNHLTLNLEERSARHQWGGGVGKKPAVKQDWAIDQIRMSNDFCLSNRFMTHFTGGLNYQIEHHLFPTLNHWAYPRVGAVLRTLCAEKGVPYFSYSTFLEGALDHYALLKLRGTQPQFEDKKAL